MAVVKKVGKVVKTTSVNNIRRHPLLEEFCLFF